MNGTPLPTVFHLAYLFAAVLFIVGLKFLSHPARARKGNLLAGLGMAVATIATLVSLWLPGAGTHHQWLILGAIVLGGGVGTIGARRVAITNMPQMVGLLNGA